MKNVLFCVSMTAASLMAQVGSSGSGSGPWQLTVRQPGRVTGKPYSAIVVIRTRRTLENGAHIDNTATHLVWQDDQGRLRQEITGSRAAVAITDPVALCVYNLDPAHKTVRKGAMGPRAAEEMRKVAGDVHVVENARETASRMPNSSVEDLGSQYVNGVSAHGVRVTTVIPAGAIGNDVELKSVSERWYSNDIHALVKSVTNDPRTGVYTYELTNIVRTTPDPTLFQIPAGYTVVSAENGWQQVPRAPEN